MPVQPELPMIAEVPTPYEEVALPVDPAVEELVTPPEQPEKTVHYEYIVEDVPPEPIQADAAAHEPVPSAAVSPAPALVPVMATTPPASRQVTWLPFLFIQGLVVVICFLIVNARQVTMPSTVAPTYVAKSEPPPPVENREAEVLKESLAEARTQITALQNQIDAQHDEREKTQARLQEMADRMALIIKQNSFLPSSDASRASTADAAQVAAMLPTVTPATSELLLLKERNRLTDYADRAIATGQRKDLQAVVDSMFDPALAHLRHAAEAEFRRVQAYYEINMSIDPSYKLPLQELFPDGTVQAEADLTDAQMTKLLSDAQKPWEVRLRCAYLLRSSQATDATAALLRALKEDPSLDVAKQAQTSFEKRVGRRFRLFDIPSIEAWWQSQQPVQ